MEYLTRANEIRAAIANYTQAKTLWLDTEIADYQTDKPKLSLIQVLDDSTDIKGDGVSIFDVLYQPELADEFIEKIMLNPAIEKVFHNASYDRQFLGKRKAKNVTCTLEMGKKIPYYLVPLSNRKLKTLAEQLCHFTAIDKTEQGGDWGQRPLTDNQLDYAKMDPVYVAQVHHRLLQLSQLIEPKPETEDIAALILRYRQIEHRWKQLDTEVKHIKERLKRAMEFQDISEIDGFQLSSQKRTTKKVSFTDLAKFTQGTGMKLDFPVTLTKALQKEMEEFIEQLPVEEEVNTSWRLSIKEQDDEELPF
ncbi:MAG: ribonuclease D [Xenococcaceae cyanobacterium]